MSHFITGRKYVPSKICPILVIGRKSVHFIYWSIICPLKKRPGADSSMPSILWTRFESQAHQLHFNLVKFSTIFVIVWRK